MSEFISIPCNSAVTIDEFADIVKLIRSGELEDETAENISKLGIILDATQSAKQGITISTYTCVGLTLIDSGESTAVVSKVYLAKVENDLDALKGGLVEKLTQSLVQISKELKSLKIQYACDISAIHQLCNP